MPNYKYYFGLITLFFFIACSKNYNDPSGPSSSQAFSSATSLTNVAAGLQNWYSMSRAGLTYTSITMDGILTKQLHVVNAGNTDEAQFESGGGSVQNTNAVIANVWSISNKIIYDADSVINKIPDLIADQSFASTLIAYTTIFKALAIGNLSMYWEKVPDTIGRNVSFISNTDGFKRAVNTINFALGKLENTTLYSINIPGGIDIKNTLLALKARYLLFAGDYSNALITAQSVDVTKTSVFIYNSLNTNPIFTVATSTNNVFQPLDSTMGLPSGLQPSLSDNRYPFYIAISANPRYRLNGFFSTITSSIPIYLPSEMTLIQAECYARLNQLENGLIKLNAIVTKNPANDPLKVGANLPAVTVSNTTMLLDLIYKHRSIELYLSGMRLTDQRRFNRPVTERNRTYLPYPFVERNDNSNTPTDPTF